MKKTKILTIQELKQLTHPRLKALLRAVKARRGAILTMHIPIELIEASFMGNVVNNRLLKLSAMYYDLGRYLVNIQHALRLKNS